ncbi:septum formation protein [Sanguibacter gelidistatuariae]|uniref:Septum formation protein n=1 Tax=Sanguibacter gelidistatuariae TaxID=1814289 RepID=A0A1G6MN56_9MICO|nr:NUDIX hydrolase [Sanguibacter gelidistatuariae]SDC56436.1 septum formation protein [Sanguibacter gelidistatuariae]
MTAGDLPSIRHPGDGWVDCACGSRHWGLFGAAGLLLARRDEAGRISHVVLQHRALWSHLGGTWGVPGGALAPGETPLEGALREAHEEAGVPPGAVRVLGEHVLDHGSWRYTTILADAAPGTAIDVRPTDPESLEIAWVTVARVTDRPLLPAFGDAWPKLLERLSQT